MAGNMYTIDDRQLGKPYPLGVTTEYGCTFFSAVMKTQQDCGIILYDKNMGTETKISFKECHKFGSIYSMAMKDLDVKNYEYNFYEGERVFTDPYAKVIRGHKEWGTCEQMLKGGFMPSDYDWEDDKPIKTTYENSILYCLNIRAFTKHKSSGVTHKGTFRGVIEKIPYLKELGITAIELMPAYEYDETEKMRKRESGSVSMKETAKQYTLIQESIIEKAKYNCWGYVEGFYFAPKAAFSADEDTVSEFKDMVKELHRNGIEVIMQFYFPDTVNMGLMQDTIKYWVLEYHIDGIHLKGEHKIPLHVIATEPLLTDTKLFYYDFPYEDIYGENNKPESRNLASYKDDYMYTIRRFLKGDEDMVGYFLEMQRNNPAKHGAVNYITNYYGFTLADMVSYEKKHNEENGENNQDGNDFNFTWNCGTEGSSRKKSIKELRLRQIKNAVTMLFMSQGTPLIYSGDELGNTRHGNNNPYCQDNEDGWVKWNTSAFGQAVYKYMRSLISLKKRHPVLRNPQELRILDYIGCGYPDISYHGEEAWRPELNNYSRYVGIMYCGFYAKTETGEDDNFFYLAYNMHWIPHTFALPKLPKGMKWRLIADTGENDEAAIISELAEEQTDIVVKARTAHIYISKQEEGQNAGKRHKYIRTAF